MRSVCCVLAVGLLSLALGACGESDEEKAQNTVCDGRADINTEVTKLASLTPATVTKDAVKESLDKIRSDISDMSSAQKDLSSDRRSQVEAATKSFGSSVKEISNQLAKSLSPADAKAQLVASLQELQASYRTAFAPLTCD